LLVCDEGRRVTRRIRKKIGGAIARYAKHGKARIIGKALHILNGDKINQIHIARKQGCHARSGIADEARHHPVPGLRSPPIGWMACDFMPFAKRIADMPISACADHGPPSIEIGKGRAGMQAARENHDVG
jgi:hypothetical protein